jgi:hypothetical protein
MSLSLKTSLSIVASRTWETLPPVATLFHSLGGAGSLTANDEYDSGPGTWATRTAVPVGTYGAGTTKMAGGKLLAGGVVASVASAAARMYDPGANSWATKTSRAVELHDLQSGQTMLNAPQGVPPADPPIPARAYVAGGTAGGTISAVHERYDEGANAWASVTQLATARCRHVYRAVLADSTEALIAMGQVPVTGPVATALSYMSLTDTYQARTSAPGPRPYAAGGLIGSTLITAGGEAVSVAQANTFAYDRPALTWSQKTSMPAPRRFHGGEAFSGKLHVAGGDNAGNQTSHYAYDLATDTWASPTGLPVARSFNGVA